MGKFQLALLGFFGFFILLAVIVFSFYRGSSSSNVTISVWGSIPSESFSSFISNSKLGQEEGLTIRYSEKPLATLTEDVTEALAQGKGPDLVILRDDQFWEHKEKLVPIPYESISERNFKDAFVEGAEVFLLPEGIYALPLAVDPMTLYYNRDILSAAGFTKPLSYWDELYAETAKLTRRDGAGNITQAAIALGETRNIRNYKDALSLLLLQAGSRITGFFNGELRSYFKDNPGLPTVPADAALDFYTQFANPTKSYYSWNKTLPEAQTSFTSGDSAYYLGFASEFSTLKSKSPTLNFSVAIVPQSRVAGKTITIGRVYAVAMTRGAKNKQVALETASKFASKNVAPHLANELGLPPARRDLLSAKQTGSFSPVFYEAALQARTWVDPKPDATRILWKDAIEAVTSGRSRTNEAVSETDKKLQALIKK